MDGRPANVYKNYERTSSIYLLITEVIRLRA